MAESNSTKGWRQVGKGLLPPAVQHLRDMAQGLPRLNNKGQLMFLPKDDKGQNVVGTASANAMKDDSCLLDEAGVDKWEAELFPHAPNNY
jgi:hypothetical protein